MKLKQSVFTQLIILVLVFALGGVVGYKVQPQDGFQQNVETVFNVKNTNKPREYKDVDFGQFWNVWEILERDYLDQSKLDKADMVDGAIEGMTRALGDPYTMYLAPQDQQRSMEDLQGSFYGVGIQLGYIDETLAVIAPLKGTPAEELGIQAGDLILHVKDDKKGLDEDTTGWSLTEALNKIRGEKGTIVTLTLFRKNNGAEPFVVDVPRGEIIVPSVELEFVEHAGKKVAHIQVSRFGERTSGELDDAIGKILLEDGVDGVLIDFRNNPGGYFEEAIDIASEFIETGVVVSQQSKVGTQDFHARGKARLDKYPVVVLVNKGSASASEIVAGALRDQKEAELVGEQTFGKGTVQDARELENGGGLHVTVARWLLPKGDWIHDEGIPVDVEVKDDPETEVDEVVLRGIEEL